MNSIIAVAVGGFWAFLCVSVVSYTMSKIAKNDKEDMERMRHSNIKQDFKENEVEKSIKKWRKK